MTNASARGATGPGPDDPGGATGAGDPTTDDTSIRWELLFDEMRDCSTHVVARLSDRARDNVTLARKGEYGLKNYLDDVRWFLAGVADETSRAVQGFSDRSGG